MNVCGVTFGGYLAKKLSFKLGNLLYKSNFYLLSEDTVHTRVWVKKETLRLFLLEFEYEAMRTIFTSLGLFDHETWNFTDSGFFPRPLRG